MIQIIWTMDCYEDGFLLEYLIPLFSLVQHSDIPLGHATYFHGPYYCHETISEAGAWMQCPQIRYQSSYAKHDCLCRGPGVWAYVIIWHQWWSDGLYRHV